MLVFMIFYLNPPKNLNIQKNLSKKVVETKLKFNIFIIYLLD